MQTTFCIPVLGQILYAMGQIQYLGMLMLWYKFSMAVMDRSILECASMRSALVHSHSSMKGLIFLFLKQFYYTDRFSGKPVLPHQSVENGKMVK